ncbi:MAG: hypothetical protein IM606_00670 [Cytophagales bacterium]|jgi:hypothetical protein|nr:hypothetical protein [Cytophagales bacterium]MCA6387016.1 hypothetical protein [Cytophagales bacterium]MCA6392046.1 hypothetical protein [Cytophagales bacterium]MCA6393674.1 hypothetical protein [Cytophagales bacterium]MCA6399431.1 hypothetical protein [Cytophagales bacterium]
MVQTNEFMLLFRFEPSNDYQPTEAEMNEQHQLWGAFIGNIAIQEKLVSTHQLGFTGKRISADKSVSEGMHVADKQAVGGNMIIKANSLDQAVEMAKECPILLMGGTVEVRNIMSM